MGWYDKFNDWYVRSIPESSDFVSWEEPSISARRRWRRKWPQVALWAVVIFVVLAMKLRSSGTHGEAMEYSTSIEIAAAVAAGVFIINWLYSFSATTISVSDREISIGTGRGRTRIKLDRIRSATEVQDGAYRVLVLNDNDKEIERLYFEADKEPAVIEKLRAGGVAVS